VAQLGAPFPRLGPAGWHTAQLGAAQLPPRPSTASPASAARCARGQLPRRRRRLVGPTYKPPPQNCPYLSPLPRRTFSLSPHAARPSLLHLAHAARSCSCPSTPSDSTALAPAVSPRLSLLPRPLFLVPLARGQACSLRGATWSSASARSSRPCARRGAPTWPLACGSGAVRPSRPPWRRCGAWRAVPAQLAPKRAAMAPPARLAARCAALALAAKRVAMAQRGVRVARPPGVASPLCPWPQRGPARLARRDSRHSASVARGQGAHGALPCARVVPRRACDEPGYPPVYRAR
jgi:hypothetical protein